MAELGSSPATRGGPVDSRVTEDLRGLIPGYAGRTGGSSSTRPAWWAHPRLRGEDPPSPISSAFTTGSSPATRGGLRRGRSSEAAAGLIPGYAGRTGRGLAIRFRPRAHPRLRGEDEDFHDIRHEELGSSPATRGGRVHRRAAPDRRRLIPGYAGRTRISGMFGMRSWAHPRLRGEDGFLDPVKVDPPGSSPATRGGLTVAVLNSKGGGLIPGYAGRTDQSRRRHG